MKVRERKLAKERLKAESPERWRAFVQLRDRYKEQGYPPAEAEKEALKSFPPLDQPQPGEVGGPPAGLAPNLEKSANAARKDLGAEVPDIDIEPWDPPDGKVLKRLSPDEWRDAYLWAAENLGNSKAMQKDAPHPAYWTLMLHFKKSKGGRTELFSSILPKLIPSLAEVTNNSKREDDGRKLESGIDAVLARSNELAAYETGA